MVGIGTIAYPVLPEERRSGSPAHWSAPDATTLLEFRHLLEQHQLSESIFNTTTHHLTAKGLLLREGTIVDATLIAAPPSTRNKAGKRDPEMHQGKKESPRRQRIPLPGKRDPEMHQGKKGKQWYFDMTSRRRRTPVGRSRVAGCGHERSEVAQVAHIGVDAHSGLVHSVIGTRQATSATSRRPKRCCMAKKRWPLLTPAIRALKNVRRAKAAKSNSKSP